VEGGRNATRREGSRIKEVKQIAGKKSENFRANASSVRTDKLSNYWSNNYRHFDIDS
jgi:hypothetical protein